MPNDNNFVDVVTDTKLRVRIQNSRIHTSQCQITKKLPHKL